MKDKDYTSIICKGFCSFYREGKEDLSCGTYLFLRNNLTLCEPPLRTCLVKNG